MLIIKKFLGLLLFFVPEDQMFLPALTLKPPPLHPQSAFLSLHERRNFTPTQETVTVPCSFFTIQTYLNFLFISLNSSLQKLETGQNRRLECVIGIGVCGVSFFFSQSKCFVFRNQQHIIRGMKHGKRSSLNPCCWLRVKCQRVQLSPFNKWHFLLYGTRRNGFSQNKHNTKRVETVFQFAFQVSYV